jgi:cysteine synthase
MGSEARVYDSILQALPGVENPTPLVRINRLNRLPGYTLYAKLEWMNPFGSVKDRAAAFLLRDLVERGVLTAERGVGLPIERGAADRIPAGA